jgi:hypothetical protein
MHSEPLQNAEKKIKKKNQGCQALIDTNIIVDLDRAVLTTADADFPRWSWYWPKRSDIGMISNK